jgi:hypothetical protein
VTEEETRAVWQGLREEVEQLGPDDIESTGEAPPITAEEAAGVLRRREQRTPPGGLAKLARLVALVPLLFLASCGLAAAQFGAIVDSGIRLACSSALPHVPAADASIAALVCQDAPVAVDVITSIIDAAAGKAKAAHLVQPQGGGEVRRVGLTCAGAVVATMPASYAATLAQEEMGRREECGR